MDNKRKIEQLCSNATKQSAQLVEKAKKLKWILEEQPDSSVAECLDLAHQVSEMAIGSGGYTLAVVGSCDHKEHKIRQYKGKVWTLEEDLDREQRQNKQLLKDLEDLSVVDLSNIDEPFDETCYVGQSPSAASSSQGRGVTRGWQDVTAQKGKGVDKGGSKDGKCK